MAGLYNPGKNSSLQNYTAVQLMNETLAQVESHLPESSPDSQSE